MGEDPGKWELSPPSPPPWQLGGFSNPSLKDWSNFLKGAVGECVAVGAVIQNSGPGTFCSPVTAFLPELRPQQNHKSLEGQNTSYQRVSQWFPSPLCAWSIWQVTEC